MLIPSLTFPKYGGLYGTPAKKGFTSNVALSSLPENLRYPIKPTLSFAPIPKFVGGKDYTTPTGGNFKTPSSPNYEIIDGVETPRVMPNLRPGVDLLNLALSNQKINQIKKTQLARKNMYYSTPQLSVRPVTDLPPEVLAAQADAVSQVRSEYAGSDPALNLISKNMAGAQRGKMRNEQIAGRASQLLTDRARFDTESRQNQQIAAEVESKNLDRAQDFADYKTGVNTAALDARSKQNANFLSQLGQNMDTRAQYNLSADAMDQQNKQEDANNLIKLAGATTDPVKKQMYLDNAAALVEGKTYKGYTAKLLPRYDQAQAGAFGSGFLNKVLGPRYK